ncbi:hypothetical protein CR513_04451, partial [Mucuna pruriens]
EANRSSRTFFSDCVFGSEPLLRHSNGTLKRLELSPKKLRSWFSHLPCVWESTWFDQEVWPYVLQAVLP